MEDRVNNLEEQVNSLLSLIYNSPKTGDNIDALLDKIENDMQVVSLTSAEYEALSDDEKNADVLYLITDSGGV